MKKDYNRDVVSDMPIEASFTSSVETKTEKKTTKPKINAIGGQKKSTNATKLKNAKNGESSSAKKLRTKLTNSDTQITDLEKLNEENIKSYRFKNKRNKVVIAILSVLLAISIISIITFTIITKLKENCNFFVRGDADASFIINGEEIDEFRSPSNLQGNRIFKFDVEVKIESGGYYYVKFIPKCYQKGVLMRNVLVYEQNVDLFYEGGDGFYYSREPIEGDQTIALCGGIILDYDYEDSLTVDNFKLDFYVYFEKV